MMVVTIVTICHLRAGTIYMAYYTIAHLVESVKAEELTEEVFDYVFCISDTAKKRCSERLAGDDEEGI